MKLSHQRSETALSQTSQNSKATFSAIQNMLRGLYSSDNDHQDFNSISPQKYQPNYNQDQIYINDPNSYQYEETKANTDYHDSEYQQRDFESILVGKDLIVDNLNSQNQILKDQLLDLNQQLDELGAKLRLYEQRRRNEFEAKKCDHEPIIMQLESILKIKDKEYTNLLNIQQSTLQQKDKELQQLHVRLKQVRAQIEQSKAKKMHNQAQTVGYEKINELESKLKLTEKRHQELQGEQAALKRIQTEQSKALEHIGDSKNYPGKVRALLGEMRELRDKNKLLEEKLKGFEDNKRKTHSKMLGLEDKCKELKMKINAAEGKVLGVEGAEGQFQGVNPENVKVSPSRKREMDENKQNLIKKIQLLEQQITDKERQNRTYAFKIREQQMIKVKGWAENQDY